MLRVHLSKLESHIWKGRKSLATTNENHTYFQNHTGIHINMIVLIYFAHVLTPKLVNCMCILNNLIGINMWISSMKALRS
jgi:hypothetical protein